MEDATPSTRRKALALNLDPSSYGVFAEAGGGQEVARWFFEVGGAAGTVAKTISAYDMAAGRLFKRSVKLYVYPTRDAVSGQIQTLERAAIPPPWHHLRDLLLEIGRVEPIRKYDERYLSIRTPEVLARVQAGDDSWEAMVPAVVAETIKIKKLFGYQTR